MRLILVLKRKWFDMIASGEKKEEYRDITKHWIAIFCNSRNILDGFKEFDEVEFIHGYRPDSQRIVLECKGVDVDTGRPEWGAEDGKEYFVIKLGKIISEKNKTMI